MGEPIWCQGCADKKLATTRVTFTDDRGPQERFFCSRCAGAYSIAPFWPDNGTMEWLPLDAKVES